MKQTPHICSRCRHYHDLLKTILPVWIRTIKKTVKLSHLLQEIPWDLHRYTSPLPCKWEALAHTREWWGQQWLVAIDLYFVPSCLQCFQTYSLKRAHVWEDWRNSGADPCLGLRPLALSLIFFSNEPHRPLGKYPEPVFSAHAPELGIGTSQRSFLKLKS